MKKTKEQNLKCNKEKLKIVGADASVRPCASQAKQNKGITLIALVITIIVMLILAAVTISMAVNGGLFDYAGKAVGETQNAIDAEQQLANGKVEVDGVWYDSIDDYIAGNPSAVHDWTRSGDTFKCSHCNATYTMGEYVEYTASGKASTTLTAAKSGMDYDQTIEAQDTYWIVLGIEDTDGDGRNETLLLTSATDLWLDRGNYYGIEFYGAAGYNNAVDEINRICKELYSNSEYGIARGMTIEDVNSALNYTPVGGMYNDGSAYQTTGNLTTKLKDLSIFSSMVTNGTSTPDGTNTEAALGEYELNGYYYYLNDDGTALANDVNDTTSTITEIERNTIFGPYREDLESYEYSYYLASRSVYANTNSTNFCVDFVNCDWWWYTGNDLRLFCSDGTVSNLSSGYRPVVSLKSKLPELMPTISFTIDGTSYSALEGMTWEEWLDSAFNTKGFYEGYNGVVRDERGRLRLRSDDNYVYIDSYIWSDDEYYNEGPV